MRLNAMTQKATFDGKFMGSFKDKLSNEISKILSLVDEEGNPPTIAIRILIIETLFDAYIEQTGFVPDGAQVQRLANWLLLEHLTDNHPDKVTREPYPFLTKRQLRTRYNREMAQENLPETLTEQKYLGGKKQPNFLKSE